MSNWRKTGAERFNIYVQEKAVLNRRNQMAYDACNLKPETKKLPKKEQDAVMVTDWMCNNFFDIRTFGAVMTTEINCGQVRGPVQLAFSKSIDPVMPAEISITRMAVTNEKDVDKERTIGRKFIVPYGLYRVEGFVSAPLAEKTGFSEEDLQLLWESLINMFEHDHSAGTGQDEFTETFRIQTRQPDGQPAGSQTVRLHQSQKESRRTRQSILPIMPSRLKTRTSKH